MKKNKKTLYICMIITIISLLLTNTVSWILETTYRDPAKKLYLQYVKDPEDSNANRMTVYNPDFSIETRKYLSDGTTWPVASALSFSMSNAVPGDSQRFVLRLTNNTTEAASVHLSLSGVSCTYDEDNTTVYSSGLLQHVYLEVRAGYGYVGSLNPNVTRPDYVFISLLDLISADGDDNTAMIYSNLVIPKTGGTLAYVELECRLWLDTSMPYYDNINIGVANFIINI